MAYRKNSKSFYAEVDRRVAEALKKQCKVHGLVKHDVTTAALRVWLALPRAIQSELVESPPGNVYDFIVSRLLDHELLRFFRPLSPEVRIALFDAARKAVETASPDEKGV